MKTKRKIQIVILSVLVIVFYVIFSDWDNFKSGLTGKEPIEQVEK